MRALRIAVALVARLLAGLAVVTVASYILARVSLGNPLAGLGLTGSLPEKAAEELTRLYGLGEPLPVGLVRFLHGLLTGDTGYSLVYSTPAYPLALEGYAYTLYALLLGVSAGVALFATLYVALGDRLLDALRLLSFIPGFIYATGWLLVAWYTGLYTTLPGTGVSKIVAYALTAAPVVASRLAHVTAELVESEESRLYVLRGEAIGAAPGRVRVGLLRVHAAPLAAYTLTTASLLLEHSVFVEPLLGYAGAGYLLYTAVSRGDPVLAATIFTLLGATSFTLVALAEAVEPLLDPRLRRP